jgi:signal transduction histidine kinase
MVVLEIGDTGKTTKCDGSGLGLPLVQQIVSAHNGTINYKTDAGHGTTLKVCLPA